jgi:hypothetical protein
MSNNVNMNVEPDNANNQQVAPHKHNQHRSPLASSATAAEVAAATAAEVAAAPAAEVAAAPAAPAAAPTSVAAEVQTVSVNINVINNFKSVLEVAVARGTFKAAELSSVGKVYDALNMLQ